MLILNTLPGIRLIRWAPRLCTRMAILLLGLSFAGGAWSDTTVLLLRHGEKPEAGLGQLSCQGLNRALALPDVLERFGPPKAIFAPNPGVPKTDGGVPYHYIRPLATIEPYAIRQGMPVDLSYDMRETDALAQRLLQGEGLQVVAWEHHLAVLVARQFIQLAGGDPAQVPGWSNDDFDGVYVLHYVGPSGGQAARVDFHREAEGLNGLSSHCP